MKKPETLTKSLQGFPGGASGKKKHTYQYRRQKRVGFDPWVGKIPGRRERQPTLAFLPGEPHGQRRLTSYSSQDHKALETTEAI